jgi:hypothetical protein
MAALQTLQADSSLKDSITNASGIDDSENRLSCLVFQRNTNDSERQDINQKGMTSNTIGRRI